MRSNEDWSRKELNNKRNIISSEGPLGACPDPITDPMGWCEYMWAKQDKYEAPKWAGDLWSTSPMDHQQLAVCMVCLWGLVMAYRQTHQNIYICLPTPHVLEAYNHKVNHDTHKELTMQECAVVQYAHAMQYISYCKDMRYKNKWVPMVKHFWAEVVEPVSYTNKQYFVSYCWHVVKPFIAVLMLYKSRCSSAMGSALYWVSTDVHGPHYGWSMRQASAMLLVPDIPLTDKKQ